MGTPVETKETNQCIFGHAERHLVICKRCVYNQHHVVRVSISQEHVHPSAVGLSVFVTLADSA